jgi:hypothetical protein
MKALFLNVSFGILAFLPLGWVFMILIMVMESVVMSELLCRKVLNGKITGTVFLSNIISGITGIIITMILNGGWWLVVWFPWVGRHEIDLSAPNALWDLTLFYFVAFVLSVLIEEAFNWLIMKKTYTSKKILGATLAANIASYLLGSIVLYSFSFS